MRAYLRSLDPGLSRPLWTLLSGSLANAFGNGVVFPFLLIYLHNVRGIGLGTAGLVLAASSVAALVAGPASGALIDHVGPRRVLVASMVLSGIGFSGFAFVHTTLPAFAAAAIAGLGNGAFWPSHAEHGRCADRAIDASQRLRDAARPQQPRHRPRWCRRWVDRDNRAPADVCAVVRDRRADLRGYLVALLFVPRPPAQRRDGASAPRRLPACAAAQDVRRLRRHERDADRRRLLSARRHLPGVREELRGRERARASVSAFSRTRS